MDVSATNMPAHWSQFVEPRTLSVHRIGERFELRRFRTRFDGRTWILADLSTLDQYGLPDIVAMGYGVKVRRYLRALLGREVNS